VQPRASDAERTAVQGRLLQAGLKCATQNVDEIVSLALSVAATQGLDPFDVAEAVETVLECTLAGKGKPAAKAIKMKATAEAGKRARPPQGWRSRIDAAATFQQRQRGFREASDTLKAVPGPELERHVLRKADVLDPSKQKEVMNRFRNAIPDQKHRAELLRTPGTEGILRGLADTDPIRLRAVEYHLKKTGDLMQGGRTIRTVEDRIPGLPRYHNLEGRKIKQAADTITNDGQVHQFKSYTRWSNARRDIRDQAITDMYRYSEARWRDGTGESVATFIYYIDRATVQGGATNDRVRRAQELAEALTEWGRTTFSKDRLTVRIVIE